MGRKVIDEIRTKVEDNLRRARSMNYYAFKRDFEEACILDPKGAEKILSDPEPNAMKAFIKRNAESDLGTKTIVELREIARGLKITGYYTMHRSLLLSEIVRGQAENQKDDEA